jgi:hypothetical protein
MSELGSLFIATTVLAFGGLGLYMLKSDDNDDSSVNIEENKEENKEENDDDNLLENEKEWFQTNRENKKGKNIKTRRSRKAVKSTRRRI